MDPLLISNGVLWVVVLALCVVVLALARQIGVLLERIAPAGALSLSQALQPGDPAPELELRALDGSALRVGGARSDGRSALLFFLAPACPVCKTLLPALRSIARQERRWLDVVLASDGAEDDHAGFAEREGLRDLPYVVSTELGLRYQVSKLPFAVLVDEGGRVAAHGMVSTREHLESLFEAKRRGVASIQEYLAAGGPGGDRKREGATR